MRNPERAFDVRGVKYRVKLVPPSQLELPTDEGDCDPRTAKNPVIRVSNQLRGVKMLDRLIHEGMHAGVWDLDEAAVEETSEFIANMLWEMGYRRQGDTQR